MILAGDIGGTNARLAYFQAQNGHLQLVSERVFPSREHSELGEIVTRFADFRPHGGTQTDRDGCTCGYNQRLSLLGSMLGVFPTLARFLVG